MDILKIKLEYKCFPIWIYDENNILIDNNLPESLIDDSELKNAFSKVQEAYDYLYVDNYNEFTYIGFQNNDQKRRFTDILNYAIILLKNKVNGNYLVKNNIVIENL